MDAATALRPVLDGLVGDARGVEVRFWDGSTYGSADAPAALVVHTPDAIRRLLTSPGELGLGRAYVAGELDLEGDLWSALELGASDWDAHFSPSEVVELLRAARKLGILKLERLEPPPEEVHLRGRRHSRARDAAAIAHHYDVSNEFYEIVLGPAMTYSCAYFSSPDQPLEDAQRDKNELVCRKLRLREGERVLDVGCGWGTFALHAARHHGARVVGVTLSERQVEYAQKRVVEEGLADRVEIRLQDERDVGDGPYDAVASIGMFEHVGRARLEEYFAHLHSLLRPQGRLLNHAIGRPPTEGGGPLRSRFARRSFIDRYVFPDGELHEVGSVVSAMQEQGFEVRDLESLREHYALTLRNWVANLEAGRDEAVEHAGEGRYRVWRLYMAASARNFELGKTQVHQTLGVRADGGDSGVPLRRGDIVLD